MMAIHAIELVCDTDASAAFVGGTNSYISVWLTNDTAWKPGLQPPHPVVT
jgi:hypothetical protein